MERAPDFDNDLYLGYLIGRLGQAMVRLLCENFHAAGYVGMTIEHWFVLKNLWMQDGLTQRELGSMAGRDKTGISRAIDWLEKHNYVLRIPDQQDRRNKRIYLTHSGKDLKDQLVPLAHAAVNEAKAGIPEADIRHCKKILYAILQNVKGHIWDE